MKVKYESSFALGARVYFANPAGLAKVEDDTIRAVIFDEYGAHLKLVYYNDLGTPVPVTMREDEVFKTKEECATATMQMMLL